MLNSCCVYTSPHEDIRGCIQKFPEWPPGARTASCTALCHYVQLYRSFENQSSEFCRHNPLCCFSTSVYCCKNIFRYRFSPETFEYTLMQGDQKEADILDLSTRCRWLVSFRIRPVYLGVKSLRCPSCRGMGGGVCLSVNLNSVTRRKIPRSSLESNPGRSVHSQTVPLAKSMKTACCYNFSWNLHHICVNDPQCSTVIGQANRIISDNNACRKRWLKWVVTLPPGDTNNTEAWASGMGVGRGANNSTL
jgi:hypothetical protein